MNKLTAELLQQLKSAAQEEIMCREASDTSDAWQDLASPENILLLVEIALQVLEAEPVADVVAWNHPSEERKCSVQLRRFDLKPGPLFMLPSQPITDTYRVIENDGREG